jgi:hypothetical protein
MYQLLKRPFSSLFAKPKSAATKKQGVCPMPNIAVKAAPFGRWTLRDKTPRSAPYLQRWAS